MKTSIEWVPSAERLPDDDETVLIVMSDGEVWMAYRDAAGWIDAGGGVQYTANDVTHWAHMPEVPNG
jgi:hypothetical protein